MAKRTYSDKDKSKAVKLAEKLGPAEAARRSKVPLGTLKSWMSRAGKKSKGSSKTKAATEAAQAKAALVREEVKAKRLEQLNALIDDLFKRANEKQIDFKGQQAKKVTYPRPPAQDIKALGWSIATLIDKERVMNGEAVPAPARPDDGEEAKSQIGEYVEALSGAAGEVWPEDEGEQCEG